MNGLLELLTNKHWMIRPEFVHGILPVIQNNLNNHIELGEEKDAAPGCRIVFTKEGTEARITEERYSAKDGRYISSWNDNKDDPFINVMFVDGPITRNGGACSYGSVEHRDMMMAAADNANCVGHIFHINTPGGSAWAKNDYQQAIDYARSKKQPVMAFIDGMCASAGMYLAALCDKRYYMHPKDEIGCIGVMAAFYTEKDGETCQYTNETYHELYDPESFDKNKEFRDVANDGNTELLVAELTKLGVEFRADVKKACPNATDEHLHGKMFDAAEVKGILVDEQKSLGEVFNIVIDQSAANGLQAAKNAKNMLNPNNESISMKDKFPAVFAALAVEEMQMNEEGAFLNTELLGNLNQALTDANQQLEEARQEIEQLKANQTTVDELNAQLATATENATTMQDSIDSLTAELNTAKESLTTANNTLAERDQTIADMQAQIADMQQEPGDAVEQGNTPDNNGEAVNTPTVGVGCYQYNPALTYAENMQRKKEFEQARK